MTSAYKRKENSNTCLTLKLNKTNLFINFFLFTNLYWHVEPCLQLTAYTWKHWVDDRGQVTSGTDR